MAGYLGSTPVPQATQHRESFTATAAQTTFATAGYTVGFVDVYLNGVHLTPADVTATNGSDVVLGACLVNDIVDVISHSAFELNAQTFTGTTTMDVVDIDGAVDIATTALVTGVLTTTAATVFNGGFASNASSTVSAGSNGSFGVTGSNNVFLNVIGASANEKHVDFYSGSTKQFEIFLDGNENLIFRKQSGNLQRMKIDSTGAVTKPAQPSFHVNNAAGLTDNIATDAFETINMGTEIYDTTNNFTSNTFTAPATGKYQMNVQLLISTMDSASTYMVFDCTTSNRNYHYIIYPTISITADGSQQIVWSFVADMDADDTAYLRATQSGGTSQADVQSDANYTRWTGYLLG